MACKYLRNDAYHREEQIRKVDRRIVPKSETKHEGISSRENLNWLLTKPIKLKRLLSYLPLSVSYLRDITNSEVWWILTTDDRKWLEQVLENNIESPGVRRELKRIWIKLIRFIDSIWTQKQSHLSSTGRNTLLHMLKTPWIALEYFIIDILNRKHLESDIKIEKWPSEIEAKKIDYIITIRKLIKLWFQLTASEWSCYQEKKRELREKQSNYNSRVFVNWMRNRISINAMPDAPVLMVVNSSLSRKSTKEWILHSAFKEWMDNWFQNWWPSQYLWWEELKELQLIWESLPELIDLALAKIKELCNAKKVVRLEKWNLVYIFKDNRLKISFYKEWEKIPKNFMYSIEIFITYALLKKLWIKPYFNSWSQVWWNQIPKKIVEEELEPTN